MSNHVSASQLSNFKLCERKWFYESIMGIRSPSTPAQERGTAIHALIEDHYNTGAVIEDKKVAAAVLALPKPGTPGVSVETEIDAVLDGIHVKGFIDMLDLSNPLHPHVIDTKTMKTFRYALTSQEMAENSQVLKYAFYVLTRLAPDATHFTLSHNQIALDTNEPPRLVSATVTADHVRDRWAQMKSTFEKMLNIRANVTNARDVTPNYNSCDAFGGCPHRERCAVAAFDFNGDIPMSAPKTSSTLVIEDMTANKPLGRTGALAARAAEVTIEEPVSDGYAIDYLFIDCYPISAPSQPQLFAEFAAPILAKVAKETGVPDWRLVDYGKGAGHIARAFATASDYPSAIMINSTDPTARVALEVLVPKARFVVTGVR